DVRGALKIHMQECLASMDAVGNKKPLAIRGPIQRLQVIPTFHVNDLRRVAAQGKNLNRPLRALGDGNAGPVQRKIPVEKLRLSANIKSGKLKSPAFQRVECGHNELFAIVG